MSNFKELAKHAGNYLLATLATKALGFISIPAYTYFLTVEEFGIYNVFLSITGIATILLTLNTEVAISRYYYDATDIDDFKRFVGTSIKLSSIVFIILSLLLVVLCKPIAGFLDFNILLTLSIIPVSLFNIINSIFQQIYQPLMQSRKIAFVSSIQAYLAFGLSIICLFFLEENKYFGIVYGTIIAMVVVFFYSIRQITAYCTNSWENTYIKYILNYSIPYLPYSLSGVIIAQFGKLFIGQELGFESAGLYSFASNISLLMFVVITVTHSAWNPYYFRYMNVKDYTSIDHDYDLIWRVTLICAAGLSLFGYEIGTILGKEEYLKGLYILPILTLGYCFYQWSYAYLRNIGYAKKTIWNAVVVVSGGISNIVLNSFLIRPFQELGIAVSFMVSYLVMLIVAMLINTVFLKNYVPAPIRFLKLFIFLFPIIPYAYYKAHRENSFEWLLIDLTIFITFNYLLLRKWLPYERTLFKMNKSNERY